MGERTAIEWTDATVNFWWGCTKVGPGCDHCYADTWARRTGEQLWGPGVPRRKIKSALKALYRLDGAYSWWAADANIAGLHATSRRRVFIQSMSDLFDKEVPQEWFDEAWRAITACDRLYIQIVTKRVSLVERRLNGKSWPQHAGLIITVVNQAEAERDIPRLLELKKRLGIPWVGLSIEPMLGPIDLSRLCLVPQAKGSIRAGIHIDALSGRYIESGAPYIGQWDIDRPYPTGASALALDWVIVGGESGAGARPMHPDWARALRDQCAAGAVPFFFKQWGEWAPGEAFGLVTDRPITDRYGNVRDWMRRYVVCEDRADRLTAHSFTRHATDLVYQVGKKRAGRLLDDVQHDGMPDAFRVVRQNIDQVSA